jgi:hypothetical protein
MSGEDGMLVIERPNPTAPDPNPESMALRCSIGRVGDADLERRVVEAVSKRLGELRGREFAPRR